MIYGSKPDLEYIQLSDGQKMYFRHYQSDSNTIMILLHGIAEDNTYLQPFANFIAVENLAHVYTPNLRGYGSNTERSGDVDYIGQHDDDILQLIQWIEKMHPNGNIILAGHSAGGGNVLRMASLGLSNKVSGFLFLAPFVHFLAPIMKKEKDSTDNTAGKTYVRRVVKLMILNKLFIRKGNNQIIMEFNNQSKNRLQNLTYRQLMSRIPYKYKKALKSLQKSTLVLIGDKDEEFDYQAYDPLFSKYSEGKTMVYNEITHDGLLSSDKVLEDVKEWIINLNLSR